MIHKVLRFTVKTLLYIFIALLLVYLFVEMRQIGYRFFRTRRRTARRWQRRWCSRCRRTSLFWRSAETSLTRISWITRTFLRCAPLLGRIQKYPAGRVCGEFGPEAFRDSCAADAQRRTGRRMMERERVLDFIRSFSVDRSSDSLKAIEAEAVRDRVPVIRRETGSY